MQPYRLLSPIAVFIAASFFILGSIATIAATNMRLSPPNIDVWQHAAAIRALIADLHDPLNPFVVSQETSRHFHPLWVGGAAIANIFGVSEWVVLRFAAYLSMFFFGLGVYLFANTYFASPWAPLVLLLTLLFGWSIHPTHTGHHSYLTLFFAAPYPASFMIGFSLILWAFTIRAFSSRYYALALVGLVAFMVATHQLGALIGLIGAASFILLWPAVSLTARLIVSLAILAGLALSMLWSYYNPFVLIMQPGNSTWQGGANFYGFSFLFAAFVPGLIGLFHFNKPTSYPMAFTLAIYLSIFLTGFAGLQIAGRFLAPVALVLQIGLAGVILQILGRLDMNSRKRKTFIAACAATVIFAYIYVLTVATLAKRDAVDTAFHYYNAGLTLTKDIPDHEPVAVSPHAVWPIVANGQKVVSIPWPEPGIHDLAERQAVVDALFASGLSQDDRRQLAQRYGAQKLIVDARFLSQDVINKLRHQAVSVREVDFMMRFDLVD